MNLLKNMNKILLLIFTFLLFLVFTCSVADNSGGGGSSSKSGSKKEKEKEVTGLEKNFILKIAPKSSQLYAIIVQEYVVTSLDISVVFIPTGAEIYSSTWVPADGPSEIRLVLKTEGSYQLTVTHHGIDKDGNTISVDETATFLLISGKIVIVNIIPGFIGQLNILTGTNDLSQFMIVRQNTTDILPQSTFNFDNIPANQRENQIEFSLYNYAAIPLQLEADKIVFSSNDFTLDESTLPDEIQPSTSAAFTLRFTSAEVDGAVKTATLTIPNNFGADYVFNISCTAKRSGNVEYTSPGTYNWMCPINNASATVLIVGGGGGGGGGSNGPNGGGGGGGAGENKQVNYVFNNITYTIVVGNGGREGDDNDDSSPGDSGRNGEGTTILNGSTSLIYADYGRGGAGGILNGGNAAGGTGGNSDLSLRGENSQSGDGDGGRGGDNGRGHGGRGNGRSGANDGDKGGDAPSNSGGGGGGGGAAVTDPSKHGEDGGHGGSGYCRIQWLGFAIQ